ncbi:MAG: hypothetical protein JO035_17650 [Betaproteobacteria bacterium]|nr:hypothetical protein [Betaproteobacteria bacterium]
MASRSQRETLARAAQLLGGIGFLRDYLDVTATQLLRWMDATDAVPDEIYTRAVELVVRGLPTEEVEPAWREAR